MTPEQDAGFMRRCLRLAARGVGRVNPNPLVGAVLARDGVIIGEGFHTYAQGTHAEVLAMEMAGKQARGSTLYINLEPCSHQGRTPPCALAVIGAGIRRVVAAMEDPNPLVSGRGFDLLRRAGIAVEVGPCREEALRLNEAFVKFITRQAPFVLLKVALSLDGKIATHRGDSQWITSAAARHYNQRLRHSYDAILVGVGTILADDPELTMRLKRPKRRPLVKVIVDTHLRTPIRARVLRPSDRGKVLIFTTRAASMAKRQALQRAGATVLQAPTWKGRVDLRAVCGRLGAEGLSSLIIEGGAEVHGSALSLGIVDKALFILAPKIIGGRHAVTAIAGQGFARLSDCPTLEPLRIFRIGSDLAVEGYLPSRRETSDQP
ncbi:MAG: bifunctional diaminohydroxyphosphoribosylaminopyrimidine deaminase/5-amino-6-(5-phosphoribosylamino)uracil reductase RibD [Acidobacteria bacterium]|nr:bifunctional diaminohydroxyphosphoribosylaminopyrimidine deaminase/5-amino-6-(5-phosphoribosylamino)uracil reductase RibD [Acidobacteriota bacterium]MBI3655323.1 bifunctional diaminohydroxyphosphoribosylaminopyrimidine deaminase/5-amino-6-(5-phosphoribosylamino)uracil reductase RibD [Acidobacteriota bacterium]